MNVRTKEGDLLGTAPAPEGAKQAGFFRMCDEANMVTLSYRLDRFLDKETGDKDTAIIAHNKPDAQNIPGFRSAS